MPAGYADYSLDQSGVLNVVNGGTGQGALTQNGVLLGNGGGPVLSTAAGAARQNFQIPAGGGAPVFQEAEFNKADVYPSASGVGVTVHGTTTPVVAPGLFMRDDTAGLARGSLGFAAAATQYFSDMLTGDFAVRADNGNLRLGTGAGAAAVVISGQNVTFSGAATAYNGRTLAGPGLTSIVVGIAKVVSGSTSYTETLISPEPAYAVYRLSGFIVQVTAGGTGNMYMGVSYNAGQGVKSLTFVPAVATGSVGVDSQGSAVFRSNLGATVSVTVVTANTAQFLYDIVLERIL
jgi:hypothetical protein